MLSQGSVVGWSGLGFGLGVVVVDGFSSLIWPQSDWLDSGAGWGWGWGSELGWTHELRFKSHTFYFNLLNLLQLPLQSMHCCTEYAYKWDMLQVISLTSTAVVPHIHLCGFCRCNVSSGALRTVCLKSLKHAVSHTAKCDRISRNILVFLEFCIFHPTYWDILNLFLAYLIVWLYG
jgi:hypothetical protein